MSTTTGATAGATAETTTWRATTRDVPVALTAAGGLVAVVGADGACDVYEAASGAPIASLTVEGGLLDAAFSPDGAHLALAGTNGYRLWHAGDRRVDASDVDGWSARARWSDDGRVAIAAGRYVVVHAADGAQLWRTGPAPSTVTDLTWLRQGREIAASAYNGVYRYARHRADPVSHLPYPGSHLAIAASANDRWICTGNQDRSIHIWRLRDATELEMAGYPDKVNRLAFDPTGRWLANTGAPDVTVWGFTGKGPGGSTPRMLRHHDTITGLAWRPGTGAMLATCGSDATAAVWRVTTAAPGRPAKPVHRFDLDAPATAITWLDQRRILVATRSGTLTALDTTAAAPPT